MMCANNENQNTTTIEFEKDRTERSVMMDDLERSHQKLVSIVDKFKKKKLTSKDRRILQKEKCELLDEIQKKNANC